MNDPVEIETSALRSARIRFDSAGEFDELFVEGAIVHIERMDDRNFWIGIEHSGEVGFSVRTGISQGNWYFNVEEDKIGGRFMSVSRLLAKNRV